MNWYRVERHLLEVWPIILLLCLGAAALAEGLYQTAKWARRPWLPVWIFLSIGVVICLLVPALAKTGGEPTNIAIVQGPIYLFPLTSFYLALRIGRAKWNGYPKAGVAPAVAVVASSWLLFALFFFVVYK